MMNKCHICGSDSVFLMNKDGYDLFRCNSCKLVYVHPQPTQEFLSKEIYSYESGFQANVAEKLENSKQKNRYKVAIDYLCKNIKNARVLDVGCGGGHFMYWAQKMGLQPFGVELNKRTADSAISQGFKVFNGLISDCDYTQKSFDAVYLGEVIEHVTSPREFIRDCGKFLKDGGYLIVTTPNINCFWSKSTLILYKIFGIPWSTATPPYHLFQFSNTNLDQMLKEMGYQPVYDKYLLPPSIRYELGSLHLLKKFKKSRKLVDLSFMFLGFLLYIILYSINYVAHPFLRRDFSMIKIYTKVI